jgi:ketosteroid isomerase-like protein
MYQALNAGDFSPVVDLCSSTVEVVEPTEIPDASTWHGHQGIRRVYDKLREALPDLQFVPVEMLEREDRVLATLRWAGTGAGSGVPTELRVFHVWTFERGEATRLQAFLDRDEAHAAFRQPS